MKKVIVKIIMIVILCLCLIISYFIYISYYEVEVTDYEISSAKINNDANIVMIADVHDQHCKVKNQIIDRIKQLEPDIILCAGDIIDNESESDKITIEFLSSLSEISDVYMSLGNHELEYPDSKQLIEDIKNTGIKILDKEYQDIAVNGNTIRIGGMYDYAFSQETGNIDQKTMKSDVYSFLTEMKQTSSFQLMMAHRPDSFIFGNAYKWDFDLVVSGHYHGGQVILPYVGGLYAPELGWFPEVDYGHYKLKDMDMIVTRGISSSNELFPRFNNPPEIVSITLKAEKGGSYEQ
ncbi:metallophosphoesterase [uncultured Thomasclavelia sp.]|uniref:metallophosphoesterase n=1 Tax=uncultured Thomasclavelia sp. TaxID=3025759 RepID=UPI00260BBFE5|nr:metallophosphoesterase [uncultured Thomasclavelia sp.]